MSFSKRSLSTTRGSISPPPLRRKFLKPSQQDPQSLNRVIDLVTIFSWNVNGIYPLLQKQISFQSSMTFPLRDFLQRHNWPQFLCLQEVKINPKDDSTKKKVQRAANEGNLPGEPTYTAEFSLPRDKYNAIGFGGKVHGVATLIRDDLQTQIEKTWAPDWDLEGRVLIHDLRSGVSVINGYWVNGSINPYRDPSNGMIQGTRHDHKLRFHEKMLETVIDLEKHRTYALLVGDMNVAPSRIDGFPNLRTSPFQHVNNRADFNKKFLSGDSGMRGIDIFRHLHGSLRRYTYHSRERPWGESCDRVDLIIVGQKLVEVEGIIVASDICDNSIDRGHSDHVPIWLTIDLSKVEDCKMTEDNSC